MPHPMIRRRGERGYILLTVLWMGVGLLLGASAFMAGNREEALIGRAEIETTRAVELARSGLNVAMADLGRVSADVPQTPRDGTPVTLTMAEGTVTYRITDEAGKIDINAAPVELLRPAIEQIGRSTGFDAFDASNIAEGIIARRGGGHASVWEALGGLGLSDRTIRLANRSLTTMNFKAQVNPRTAPEPVLLAIPGLGPSDVADILERRRAGRDLPRFGSATVWLDPDPGRVYTIEADARLSGGATATMIAQVGLVGLSFRGGLMRYEILQSRILR